MKTETIEVHCFSGKSGLHWQAYMTVPAKKAVKKLAALQHNNPDLAFRLKKTQPRG